MRGRVVELQTRGQLPRLRGWKGLRERPYPLGIEVITDQPETVRLRILGLQEVLDLRGPVHGRSVLSDPARAPPTQRLCKDKDMGGAVPLVLLVRALRLPRFRRQRLSHLFHQRHGLFIHAHQRDLGSRRLLLDFQDILHMRHPLPTLFGWNDPHLPQMGFQGVFLGSVSPSQG
jgi:hypothetical protein